MQYTLLKLQYAFSVFTHKQSDKLAIIQRIKGHAYDRDGADRTFSQNLYMPAYQYIYYLWLIQSNNPPTPLYSLKANLNYRENCSGSQKPRVFVAHSKHADFRLKTVQYANYPLHALNINSTESLTVSTLLHRLVLLSLCFINQCPGDTVRTGTGSEIQMYYGCPCLRVRIKCAPPAPHLYLGFAKCKLD